MSDAFQPSNKELASGIKSYEAGDYQTALITLKNAQEMGLNDKHDQVLAHKYLAFIHCVSGREQQCRDEFRKALTIDPAFDLTAAEAGHPVWGPVFRSEKAISLNNLHV
ncbi:MAG: TssQ family T6SS-associated lipoprotein [Nitrosomonadales bacterium]